MKTYFAIFSIAAVAALVITPVLRRLCQRLNWLDHAVDDRRLHDRPVPRLGGIAIYLAFAAGLVPLILLHNLLTNDLASIKWKFFTILAPSTLILLFGIYDDLRGTKAPAKFAAQIVAAILLFSLGGRIEILSIPFVGTVELPIYLSFALTIIWTVGLSNAFNLIDGLDGLAAGAALFATFVMLSVALVIYNPFVAVVAMALTGSLIGFLRYNFNPASIFLGDSGALFLGFLLAALSVQGMQKASTVVAVAIPLLAFGLPVVDTGVAVVRRFISGKPLFKGDREHIHHKLLERGWSQRRVALSLYGICAILGLMAMLFVVQTSRTAGLVLFVVAVCSILGIGHLRYQEVDELKASVKRNVGERRVRAANNLRIRRAGKALSKARELSDIFRALEGIFESGEFVFATACLSSDGRVEPTLAGISDSTDFWTSHEKPGRDGVAFWSWGTDGITAADVFGSKSHWCLRIPLATDRGAWGYLNLYRSFDAGPLGLDVNYLCGFLRDELAGAVERIAPQPPANLPEHVSGYHAAAGR
jgi:UDP-GlcNAc:undecaprenyl-phosphate GlcNAc-1-phosphate transferase